MSRPSGPPRPMRDHVRVTPGARNAAASLPGLLLANKHGIDYVQGHALDAVLRKGVRVTEAIKTVAMTDD